MEDSLNLISWALISPPSKLNLFPSLKTISSHAGFTSNLTGLCSKVLFAVFITVSLSIFLRKRNIFFELLPGRPYVFPGNPGNLEYCTSPECVNTA